MEWARVVFTGVLASGLAAEAVEALLLGRRPAPDAGEREPEVVRLAATDRRCFVAVIEGPASDVLVAFAALGEDPGLERLQVLGLRSARSRLFLRSRCVDLAARGRSLTLASLSEKGALRFLWDLVAPGMLCEAPRAA